jgi:hypothetical protein
MNRKYQNLNFDIIRKMDDNQRFAFENFATKSNSKYLELFKIYTKMDSESNIDVEVLEEYESQTGNKANNDLNDNLHRKLCEFIHENFKETEDPYFEAKKNLEISRTLIIQKQYGSAIVILEKSFRSLQKIITHNDNHHLFLQWINLTAKLIHDHANAETLNLGSKKFKNSELFDWISRIASISVNNITQPKDIKDVSVGNNLFMGLLRDHLIEKQRYDLLLANVSVTSANFGFGVVEGQKAVSKWLDPILLSNQTLLLLEGIYASIKLDDRKKFDVLIMEFDSRIRDIKKFNYALFLFMKLHQIDLEMRFNLQSLAKGHHEIISDFLMSDINLIGEKEVSNFALRVEFNQGLIFILNRDYLPAEKLFSKEITFPKVDVTIKYYWKVFYLITYLRVNGAKSSEKVIGPLLVTLLKMKTGESNFSQGFIKLVDNERTTKNIFTNMPAFLEKNKPENLYDEILRTGCV